MIDTPTLTPAVFLDRDGTLIEEVNFLSRVEDLKVFPFTRAALQKLVDAGFLLIVITNQSGIGRGLFSERDMHSIHEALAVEFDGLISGFYHCPHLPDEGCDCRKPKTTLIRRAAEEHHIDLSRSWFVGDKNIDVLTGENAGISTCLVSTGYGVLHKALLEARPTVFADNIGDAADEIVARAAKG
ncbi:MAG: D-alpha,beta-D-heptose 1,7-bisphosphate phosphatase [Acidobacteria bacterium OLB17]|nr:MAG: D-alpha,beta-D-heptose 1,7-bisphosphate phosphatase [Acidobacteria bacterium OLB17]MCZ2389661.1 HAD family hydrolase [Acidobacteriota bacterium]